MIFSDKGNVSFRGNDIELITDLIIAIDGLSERTGISAEKILEVINVSLNALLNASLDDYLGEADKDEADLC